jgi:hypothetical protein
LRRRCLLTAGRFEPRSPLERWPILSATSTRWCCSSGQVVAAKTEVNFGLRRRFMRRASIDARPAARRTRYQNGLVFPLVAANLMRKDHDAGFMFEETPQGPVRKSDDRPQFFVAIVLFDACEVRCFVHAAPTADSPSRRCWLAADRRWWPPTVLALLLVMLPPFI